MRFMYNLGKLKKRVKRFNNFWE